MASDERLLRALGRAEAAARKLAQALQNGSAPVDAALQTRHIALKQAVSATILDIDRLLAEGEAAQ